MRLALLAFAALSLTSTISAATEVSCYVNSSGSQVDARYCAGRTDGMFRCYVDLVYSDFRQERIWSKGCARSPVDCDDFSRKVANSCLKY